MLYDCVSIGVEIETKLVCSTRSHTRACGRPCGISQYTLQV
ncbi:hypothetical protein F383_29656 [Gossypium arboreum]|uniref:Uncharacterized protein n=1 Tax=Gossypium arboreum TaxID=29729 RepID=A0A0B0MV16_GOSAR|nr:hypothetical protein F383_29656 [Gossypium arboreum]